MLHCLSSSIQNTQGCRQEQDAATELRKQSIPKAANSSQEIRSSVQSGSIRSQAGSPPAVAHDSAARQAETICAPHSTSGQSQSAWPRPVQHSACSAVPALQRLRACYPALDGALGSDCSHMPVLTSRCGCRRARPQSSSRTTGGPCDQTRPAASSCVSI